MTTCPLLDEHETCWRGRASTLAVPPSSSMWGGMMCYFEHWWFMWNGISSTKCQKGMLIICFLRRVSEPVAALKAAFLPEEDARRVDVVILDSARGLTADRVHVIFSSRFVGSYDQLQGIQADPNRLYVAYARGRWATTVWMEQEPLGLPSDAEECWTDWLPEFENHPGKKLFSPSHQQWIEFAAKRHALLSRGEVEPATTGSAHSAPSHSDWNMSSAHQTFTWRALVGTRREHFKITVGYAWNCQIERSLTHKVDKACEEAQKKVLSTSTSAAESSSAASLASIVEKVVLRAPTQMVREAGIGRWLQQSPKQSVDPTKPEWLHKAIKFAMLVPNAVDFVGRQRPSTAVCAVCRPSWPCATPSAGNALDDDGVVGFGATMWILHGMWRYVCAGTHC